MTEEITALINAGGTDIEVVNYYNEALKLKEYAEARVIRSLDDVKLATDDLSAISRLKKAMEEKRKDYVKPLQDQVKAINDTYKTLMQPIEAADLTTRNKILAYQKEQEHIRREQEEINRMRLEAAQKEMKLKGEITESVNLVEVAPEAPKRVQAQMGAVSQRMIRKWKLVDFSLVPDQYKMLNEMLIGKMVRAGIPGGIPGIRIYEEPVLTVTPKKT